MEICERHIGKDSSPLPSAFQQNDMNIPRQLDHMPYQTWKPEHLSQEGIREQWSIIGTITYVLEKRKKSANSEKMFIKRKVFFLTFLKKLNEIY